MRWLLIPVLALALVVAVPSCAGPTAAAPLQQATATPSPHPTPTAADIDRSFIQAMVLHHTAAIAMARVEVQRGNRADVKQLAQTIVSSQENEVKELQQIAQQDYHFTPSTTLPADTQQGVLMGEPILMNFPHEIDELKSTSDPDTMFLQMMIPHHAMAIVQPDTQMMYGTNARLKTISQNIVSAQASEIGEMENLLQHH